MKILITGGGGFVGRHLTKRLSLEKNNQITIVDNLSTGKRIEEWPEHLKCKVSKIIYDDCINYFKNDNTKFDIIFHLAAVVEGRLTIENNPLKIATDLQIDSTMFQWAIKNRPSKIVYFSSSAIYPIKYQTRLNHRALSENLIDINHQRIDVPDMIYGWSKLTGEFLSNIAVKKHNLNIAIYRPFSGYGEDQDLTYPFPAIMNRIIKKENPINVWGDGSQSRDFIYIEDCIDAILLTFSQVNDATPINLGTGIKTSFVDLIKKACKINQRPFNINQLLDKPIGVHSRYADIRRQSHFGIKIKTSLDEGIKIVSRYLEKKQ